MRSLLFSTRLTAGRTVATHLLLTAFFLVLAQAPQAYAGLAAAVTLQPGASPNIQPGEITFLEITLSNNNDASVINNVAFSNPLPGISPNVLKVAAAPIFTCFDPLTLLTTTPLPSPVTAAVGGQSIVLAGAVIPARDFGSSVDGSCTLVIPVTAGTSSGAAAAYAYDINGGDVTGNDGSAVQNVGNVSQSINVLAFERPTIGKSFSNGVAILGGAPRTLTITVSNPNASVALENFGVSDSFPTDAGGAIIQVVNPASATASCPGGTAPGFRGPWRW